VLFNIPHDGVDNPPVKQIKAAAFTGSAAVRRARQEGELQQIRSVISKEQKKSNDAKFERTKTSMSANLPPQIKPSELSGLRDALRVAIDVPLKSRSRKKLAMPKPVVLPAPPKTAPKLSALKKIEERVSARAAAKAEQAGGEAPSRRRRRRSDDDGDDAKPKRDAQSDAADAKIKKLLAAQEAQAGAGGQPGAAPADASRAAAARAAQAAAEAAEDRARAEHRARRKRRLEAEDRREREEDAARERRRRRRSRKLRRGSRESKSEGKRRGSKAGKKDWALKFKSSLPPAKKPYQHYGQYASADDPTCPRCKKRFLRKKWPIVLNPVSTSEIDRPLYAELHKRVDYLIEPQEKKLNLEERVIRAARAQIDRATNNHLAVYDWQLKHKKMLVVPQYIQDEQKIVQLD
jgi:hypothetical protein